MSDLLFAVEAIRCAADEYRRADAYYRGDVDEVFASPAIQRALRESGKGYRINLARRPVEAVLDRMKIASVAVPGDESATSFLNSQVWDANRLGRVARTVNRGALVFGDSYLTVWDGLEDGSVETFYNSPVTTRMFYDRENPGRKSHAAKVWSEGDGDKAVVRVNLYFADRIERYTTMPGSKGDNGSDFVPYGEDGASWPIPNPYGEVPVFHFRTDEPYGRPEHADAFGPQNAITKLVVTQMATTDYQGFPQRYALLTGAEDLVQFDDDDEDEGGLESGPGKVWKLPGVSQVGQFDAANVDAFLKPLGVYTRFMAAATATPLRFFDPAGQIPSGEALRADEAPLAEKIQDRQTWFGDEWSAALSFAMKVAGRPVPDVDVRWRPVQVVSDLEGWRTVAQKLAVGVPFEQVMTEAGYLPEQVQSWPLPAGPSTDVPAA